ncbi:hypothetical protein GpartN1_g3996.t1 [Galdieria partita]|uniref:N-acetyltransferase domain-containing protein n=1 Tax=Galdieria partita TaxID=83374 RepID=A0A9C7UR32_9RHOD|nr:hypothetical protein GpartN1_g3996.t1 [Galdieria partita]
MKLIPFTRDRISDLVQLATIHAGWSVAPQELEIDLQHPNFHGWLAVDVTEDGMECVVGSVTLICQQVDSWLGFVVVAIPFRRKGIAKLLVRTALAFLHKCVGLPTLCKLVASPMGAPLYAEFGFRSVCGIWHCVKSLKDSSFYRPVLGNTQCSNYDTQILCYRDDFRQDSLWHDFLWWDRKESGNDRSYFYDQFIKGSRSFLIGVYESFTIANLCISDDRKEEDGNPRLSAVAFVRWFDNAFIGPLYSKCHSSSVFCLYSIFQYLWHNRSSEIIECDMLCRADNRRLAILSETQFVPRSFARPHQLMLLYPTTIGLNRNDRIFQVNDLSDNCIALASYEW